MEIEERLKKQTLRAFREVHVQPKTPREHDDAWRCMVALVIEVTMAQGGSSPKKKKIGKNRKNNLFIGKANSVILTLERSSGFARIRTQGPHTRFGNPVNFANRWPHRQLLDLLIQS